MNASPFLAARAYLDGKSAPPPPAPKLPERCGKRGGPKQARPVVVVFRGERFTYASMAEASRQRNVTLSTVGEYLAGRMKPRDGASWSYA